MFVYCSFHRDPLVSVHSFIPIIKLFGFLISTKTSTSLILCFFLTNEWRVVEVGLILDIYAITPPSHLLIFYPTHFDHSPSNYNVKHLDLSAVSTDPVMDIIENIQQPSSSGLDRRTRTPNWLMNFLII